MPTFNVTVTEAHLAKLQAVVQRYNDQAGTALTVLQWLTVHLQEIAIADELNASAAALRRAAEEEASRTLEAAVKAERDRLIQGL